MELFGINETLGYQVGFEYVRQLAIHLRNSINATSNAKRDTKLYTTGNTVIHWTFGPEFCLNIVILKRVAKP